MRENCKFSFKMEGVCWGTEIISANRRETWELL